MQLFLTIALCLMIGSATAYFANQRGRDPLIWFMLGLLLGIFGLLLLFLLPVVQEERIPKLEDDVLPLAEVHPLPPPVITHDYLVKDWYYYDRARQQHGPIRFDKLKELWKTAELNEQSFVWSEGMKDWTKIEEVPNLHSHLQLS